MYAVGRLISRGVYTVSAPFHLFGGAVDIIVVQQQDGSFKSSPWYVKFGKFQGVLKAKEKIVKIDVNGEDAGFHMYLNHKGEAFFLMEVDEEEGEGSIGLATFSSGDEMDDPTVVAKIKKSKSCDFVYESETGLVTQVDMSSGQIVGRTNSRRSKIFGLMFGKKPIEDDSGKLRGESSASMKRINSLETAEIAADLLEMKWSTNLSGRVRSVEHDDKSLQVNCEQNIEPHVLDENYFKEVNEVIPKVYDQINECDIGDSSFDDSQKVLVTEMTVLCLETPNSSELEEGPVIQHQHDKEQYSEVAGILSAGVLDVETETLYADLKTIESLKVGGDTSGESFGVLNIRNEECLEDITPYEVICKTPELEVSFEPEYDPLMAKECLTDVKLLRDKSSLDFPDNERIIDCKESSNSPHFKPEPQLSYIISGSPKDKLSQNAHQERTIEKPTRDTSLVTERDEVMDLFSSTLGTGHIGNEDSSTSPKSDGQRFGAEHVLSSVEESELEGSCIAPTISNSHLLVKQEENLGNETETSESNSSMNYVVGQTPNICDLQTEVLHLSFPSSESSDEDQFQVRDNEVPVHREVQCVVSDSITLENHQSVTLVEFQNLQQSSDLNLGESSSLVHEYVEEFSTISRPIFIPRARNKAENEVERMVQSLPIIRSHIDDLKMTDFPLSCSLNSGAERSRLELHRKVSSSFTKIDSGTKLQLQNEQYSFEDDSRAVDELKKLTANKVVDISLCKHLIYEGMGAEAASQAFEAEKMGPETFDTLGPELVKNNMLVVKISDCYFPWDAAVPIILRMTSFGLDQLLESEGMISVNEVEKSLEGDSAKSIPTGGSWRVWPFGSRRSVIINNAQPAPECLKTLDTKNAPEDTSDLIDDQEIAQKGKIGKKKVKLIVPTSEQLATLNLKEGRNVVTFTFSTAMLGKQQVDARVYLWKWNTRIVISDVDGTITKSDVLGQFMPLVGKDWSHTGVAHLFSAIKENGYQLLFLSARAISQAHLTRQFLFNLKQDGKALPDGPVVISPDGLFPSLYREVIRRAPHEFKIACLMDIKALFPPDCNPFYAGFGNRYTDELSYLKVGIPKGKIFTINAKGEVAVNRRVDRRSYTSIHTLVHGMFPAMSSAEQEEYNSWNFWKMPIADIDI